MSTDRELLEDAAKAAGLDVWFAGGTLDNGKYRCGMDVDGGWEFEWNPLADDGDALRLVVKLCGGSYWRIEQNDAFERACVEAYVPSQKSMLHTEFFEPWCGQTDEHKQAATRRAIVRAAAEFGKQKGGAGA